MRKEGTHFGGKLLALNAALHAPSPADSPQDDQSGGAGETRASRWGFITSKRVGNAVKRNRARRLLREAVRALMPVVVEGWDVVLVASRAIIAPGVRMQHVQTELKWLAERAKLLKPMNQTEAAP